MKKYYKKYYNGIIGWLSGALGGLVTILLGLQYSYLTFALGIGFFTLIFFIILSYIIKI